MNDAALALIRSLTAEHIDVLLVLSKIDKVTQAKCSDVAEEIKRIMGNTKGFKGVFPISSTKKLGIESIRKFIIKYFLQR